MSIATIIPELIETYPKNYFGQDEIDPDDTVDPLALVVPTVEEFFGTFVCNFVVFTDQYVDWDEQVVDSKQRLVDTFDKFARYELHFYIDMDGDAGDMEILLTDLADELEDQNVTYEGKLSGDALKASMQEVIEAFNAACSQ